jgi:ribonuclease D
MSSLKLLVPSEMNPPLRPIRVVDSAGLALVKDYLSRVNAFTIDVETNFTDDLFTRKIRVIQVGDRNEQYIIDLLKLAGSTEALVASQGNYGAAAELCLGELISILRPALESNSHLKIGVNLQFDYEQLFWNLGIRMWHFYDCLLAEKAIYAGEVHFMAVGFWAMEFMVGRYCGLEMQDTKSGKTFNFTDELTDEQVTYCALDCRMPVAVRTGQLRRLEMDGLLDAAQIEFDAIPAFGDMHVFGVILSSEAWINLYNSTLDKQKKIVAAMDSKFTPVIGLKHVTEEDERELVRLETLWRETVTDKELRKKRRIAYMAKRKAINDRRKLAFDCEGEAFLNYGSNKQLKEALWEMGFKKKQLPDTNDRTLEKLAKVKNRDFDVNKALKQDPTLLSFNVIDLIRLYRTTYKALTTYGLQWVSHTTVEYVDAISGKKKTGVVNPLTGRIHSNINQYGAATGRTSSDDPNVQNIPRDSDYRFCFVAAIAHLLVTVDMSGAELRILAEMSGEPVWLEAFANGWDVHSVGAEIVFGVEWVKGTVSEPYQIDKDGKKKWIPRCAFHFKELNKVDKKGELVSTGTDHLKCECPEHKRLRQIAKTINFMLAYGGGPQKLADEVGITFEEADTIINEKYKPAFPTVTKFLESLGQSASTSLQARTMDGRRRKWKRPTWEDAKLKVIKDLKKGEQPTQDQIRRKYKGMFSAIKREGMNCPIQGTNADFIKRAMGCGFDADGKPYLWHIVWPKYKSKMVLMVHDELVTEAPADYAEEVKAIVGDAMTRASAVRMKKVIMETEGNIDVKWSK